MPSRPRALVRIHLPGAARRATASALVALCASAFAPLAACGGDDDEIRPQGDSPAARETSANGTRPPGTSPGVGTRAEEVDEQLDREDEAFDEAFERTPFDRVVAKLPLDRPPLYVRQFIMTGGHKLYIAVKREQFFCDMSPDQRQAAVESYYREAGPRFQAAGIDDLVLIVTRLAETAEHLPAFAVGKDSSIRLTDRGRAGC